MGRSRFQNHWMERREFVDWLRRDSNDVFRAYCRVCQLSFDVKNMGEGAVKSNGAEAKHVANMTQGHSVSTQPMAPRCPSPILPKKFLKLLWLV